MIRLGENMSLKKEIHKARQAKSAQEADAILKHKQWQGEQIRLHQECTIHIAQQRTELTAKLDDISRSSKLPELLTEAVEEVEGKLNRKQLYLAANGSWDSLYEEHRNIVATCYEYKLTWDKKQLTYDRGTGEKRRVTLLEQFGSGGFYEWNCLTATIDSNGIIQINGGDKILAMDWTNDSSIVESALASAIVNPNTENDIPRYIPYH